MGRDTLTLTFSGHTAWPGKIYPGQGNPIEYYPSCTCGWRGLTIDTWRSANYVSGDFNGNSLERDANGHLVPSYMIGEQIDALAQVIGHLKPDLEEIKKVQTALLEELNDELKSAANELRYKDIHTILDKIELTQDKIESLKLYEEASKIPIRALEYTSKENQKKLEFKLENQRRHR